MSSNKNRLSNIDVLRGIAAIAVTYFHLSGNSGLSIQTASIGKYGYLGVEIFFVISGFILPYNLYKYQYRINDFFRYLLKRIIRIDPPYILAIIISLIIAFLTHRPLPSLLRIALHLGYANWIFSYEFISPVFWTLAIEFQFYVLIGLLFYFFANTSSIISLFTIAIILASSKFLNNGFYISHYFGMFGLGILIFRKKELEMTLLLFCISIMTLTVIIYFMNGLAEAIISISTLFFILHIELKKENKFKEILLWFGAISYSLYLTHWEIGRSLISVIRHFKFLGEFEYFRLFFGMVGSIIFAWGFNKFIEIPSIKLSKLIKIKN
jgi:peptidoglycan/LPS O-acetylase OafA/YrhL